MWSKIKAFFKSLFGSTPQLPPPAEVRPRGLTLGIVVGPGKTSPVLAPPFQSSTAFQYCAELGEMIRDAVKKSTQTIAIHIVFKEMLGVEKAYRTLEEANCDVVIELQLNAFNGSVKGTETLCSFEDRDLFLAGLLHRGICNLLGRTGKFDRGVKALSRADRGGASAHAFPLGANCIIEPLFCDNTEEAKMAIEKKSELAKCIVDGVILWGRKQSLL